MTRNTWPRNRSTSSGGGLSTSSGGGLSTSSGGGMSTSSGGGMSTSSGGGLSTSSGGGLSTSSGNTYRSNTPPMHVFIPILQQRGLGHIADLLASAHHLDL